ncbi:hypothetical protein BDP81DRAFT_169161 [Colletotrichum phormii]|uniref:Uncharacterized protein n=1 Tax=Colletotrichum phormii TaxID=359342 RepID=A0AAJ0E9Q1_9PEZI|nr:uncharacterized protein BDP81DRAFT_169161 [Colletotrichum phormii]KAK1621917.1 hypothetical protein BDP81DRAFT_169161 [Colletotrichum phormii]
MQTSFFMAALLAAVVPAFAYEVGTGSCCIAQLKACHEQGADACIWTNAAICVNNPKNSVPIDETCNEQCPTASVKTPDGFVYKFQKHAVGQRLSGRGSMGCIDEYEERVAMGISRLSI